MKVAKNLDLVVECDDDVAALQILVRPADVFHACEAEEQGDDSVWSKLGLTCPPMYPVIVELGFQGMMNWHPYMKHMRKLKKKPKLKIAK
jgi:hypothetical protein